MSAIVGFEAGSLENGALFLLQLLAFGLALERFAEFLWEMVRLIGFIDRWFPSESTTKRRLFRLSLFVLATFGVVAFPQLGIVRQFGVDVGSNLFLKTAEALDFVISGVVYSGSADLLHKLVRRLDRPGTDLPASGEFGTVLERRLPFFRSLSRVVRARPADESPEEKS